MADRDELRGSARILNDIATRRESISDAVDRLEKRIHGAFDWKGYIGRRPYAAVGLAFGTGLVLSGFFKRKRSPMERVVDALADRVEALGEDLCKSAGRLILKATAPGLVRGALYGIASKALLQYLHNGVSKAEGNGFNPPPETDRKEAHRMPPAMPPKTA